MATTDGAFDNSAFKSNSMGVCICVCVCECVWVFKYSSYMSFEMFRNLDNHRVDSLKRNMSNDTAATAAAPKNNEACYAGV